MLKMDQIKRLHVELTTRCNARCPMCMRNYRGSDYNSGYPLTELTLDDFKRILTPKVLKRIQRVSFNGNLGDFGLARDAKPIVDYLIENRVRFIYISTNGSMRTPEWWAELAHPSVTIGFDLDGLADTHHLYRQDTDWNHIIENAKRFIAAGGNAEWKFIPFPFNRHQEQDCRALAEQLGFKRFDVVYDGRDSGPVFDRDGTFSHWIGEPYDHEPDLAGMRESHITWFDHRTVQNPRDVPEVRINCSHKWRREIYLAADGTVYPCCYLGFYPGQMKQPGNSQLESLVAENNALVYGLPHAIKWFENVERTWALNSIADGRLFTCVNTCGQVNS